MPIKVIFEIRQKAFYKSYFSSLQFLDSLMTLMCTRAFEDCARMGRNDKTINNSSLFPHERSTIANTIV